MNFIKYMEYGMTDICRNENCTGCAACYSCCPKKAISMEPDNDGFFVPVINKDLCINCGLCVNICPANKYKFDNNNSPEVYAVMADDILRKTSSSGGAFGIIATYVLENNGIVCGAAFNDDMVVEHIMVSDKKDLYKLQGSKYVQSNNKDIYKQIKQQLDYNKLVLYSGCSCQVAGLNKFLAKKYDNLITIDLVCHGVPSPKVLKKYLDENYPKEHILDINFRDKRQNGWGYCTTITTTKGKYSGQTNEYIKSFFANMSLRNCCYSCKYTKFPRPGDFTIGDCWGAKKDIDDKKGTSILILNNRKAVKIYNSLNKTFKKTKKMTLKFAKSSQPNLNYPSGKHPARKDFFNMLETNTIKESYEQNVCSVKNVALLNFHWENCNYGAVLTSVALNMFLNSKGYNAQNIDYIPTFPWIREEKENPYFDEFRRKYLPSTNKIYEYSGLVELNNYFSTFVVGSDQVFRYPFIKHDMEAYFLNFANSDKNIISAAASFGSENVESESKKAKELYKLYLSNFNSLSIREKSGVEFCEKLGVNAIEIIDPVFYLDKNIWEKIAQNAENKECDDFVFYTIDPGIEPNIIDFAKKYKNSLNISSIKDITKDVSIEEWLLKIKNCKFFVADSFHGICFAIIFNKPFVCVRKAASTRMKSLLETLEIQGRLYSSFDEIDLEKILEPINYNKVNKKISELAKYAADWLDKAIQTPVHVDNKNETKKAILKYQNKIAKSNYLKYIIKSGLYKIRAKLKKKKANKYLAKADSVRHIYRNCKFIIKRAERNQF